MINDKNDHSGDVNDDNVQTENGGLIDNFNLDIEIELKRSRQKFRHGVSTFIIITAVVGFLVGIVYGALNGNNFEPANIWWASLGPFVGFLIRTVIGGIRDG